MGILQFAPRNVLSFKNLLHAPPKWFPKKL